MGRGAVDGIGWRALAPLVSAFAAASAALLSPVQASAQDVVPPKAYATTPGGINASDGSFVYSSTDLSMGPLSLERYHRGGSKQPNDAMFGTNFSSNFDIYVGRNPGTPITLIVHIGNSASGQYQQYLNSISSDNVDSYKGILSYNGTNFSYIDSSGAVYTFTNSVITPGVPFGANSNSQRVSTIDFPDGRRQTFSYTAAGQPRLVEDSSGYAILFDYNGSNDVSAACIVKRSEAYVSTASTCAGLGSAALTATYGYTSGRLTSMTDPLGKVTNYTNSLTGVTCVRPPGYASCTMSQNGGGPSSTTSPSYGNTQVLTDGGSWNVAGQDWAVLPKGDEGSPAPYDGHVEVTVTSPDSQVTNLTFTKSSPYTMSDPLSRVTSFKFYGGVTLSGGGQWGAQYYGSMLIEATYPEGNKYQADYGGPFNSVSEERHIPKPGSSEPTLTKKYGYTTVGCTTPPYTYQNCARPIWIRDAKNNQTDFTYASHGGVLTEMQPAPSTGAARPLKVTTWTQRYAWTKNSGGTLVQGALPVWVKNTETVCETLSGTNPAATCNTSAPQTVTTYEYGANGTGQSLLLMGVAVTANGATHRTCYGYDSKDRKIFETQPNAMKTSCP